MYCRISFDREGDGLGVAGQEKKCRELAARLGWSVVDVFVDNDRSTYSGKPRKDYIPLLVAMRAGELDAVLAWHPSGPSRGSHCSLRADGDTSTLALRSRRPVLLANR